MTPPVTADGGWGAPPTQTLPTHTSGVPLGAVATAPASDQRPRGGIGMLVVGLALILVSLVAGGVMLAVAATQQQTAIEDMARAPVGCLTELDFTETGTFYVYAETRGVIGELDGTCSNADRDYEFDEAPRVTLVLTDEDDEFLDLERTSGLDYDAGGFAGTAVRMIEIEDEGSYILRVESRDDEAVVAVGRDVTEVGTALGAGGLIVAVVGVLAGLALLVLGIVRRRRRGTPVPNTPAANVPGAVAPATTPPATWGVPPHTVPPHTVGPPTAPPPPPASDDTFWRPPPPSTP